MDFAVMRWCSLCCCSLPEDSSKRRLAIYTAPCRVRTLNTNCKIPSHKDIYFWLLSRTYHGVLCSRSPSSHSLVVYSVDELHRFSLYTDFHISACRNCAYLWSIIQMSHDTSHPIGSMQIPLEHTKTVQEFPDPSFRALVMKYIQRCGDRRGLGSRLCMTA